VAGLLVTDVETRRIAASLLRVVGAFQLFDGLQGVATGALRGAGITAFTFGANLVSYWLVGLPVAVALAFGLGLGPVGLYVGLTAGLGLAAALLVGRFVVASRRGIRPVV
jgi:MATE family multidrug resistance protein